MHHFVWLDVLSFFAVFIDEELAGVSCTKMTDDFKIM